MAVTTVCSWDLSLIEAFLHTGFLPLHPQSVDLIELTFLGQASCVPTPYPVSVAGKGLSAWLELSAVHEPITAIGREVNPR